MVPNPWEEVFAKACYQGLQAARCYARGLWTWDEFDNVRVAISNISKAISDADLIEDDRMTAIAWEYDEKVNSL